MKRALLALAVLGAVALIVATALALLQRREEERRARNEESRRALTLEHLRALKERILALGDTTAEWPPRCAGPITNDDNGFDHVLPADVSADVGDDGWGRSIYYRRPGPLHSDGWDIFSLGPNGRGTDLSLVTGESYTPEPRSPRVDELYAKETKERLEELRALVTKLERKPETRELSELIYALVDERLAERTVRARFMDGWGHRLRFACPGVVHKTGWDLWSIGPNGEDESGAGDDLLVGAESR